MGLEIREMLGRVRTSEGLARAIEGRITTLIAPSSARKAAVQARVAPGVVRALKIVADLEGGETSVSGIVCRAVVQYLGRYRESIRGRVAFEIMEVELGNLLRALPPGEIEDSEVIAFGRGGPGLIVRTPAERVYRMCAPGLAARIELGPEPTAVAFFAEGELIDGGLVDDDGYHPPVEVPAMVGVEDA